MGPAIRRTHGQAKRGLESEPLAIRFVNTLAWRLSSSPEERLGSPRCCFSGSGRTGSAMKRFFKDLSEVWRGRPADAAAFYETAIQLREAIYDILVAKMRGVEPAPPTLTLFNDLLTESASGAAVGMVSQRTGLAHARGTRLPVGPAGADRFLRQRIDDGHQGWEGSPMSGRPRLWLAVCR